MDITLTLGEFCMLAISIALFVLLLRCISLIRHLIPSVKSLAKVMKNVETITDSAANVTQGAEGVANDVVEVTSALVSAVKGPTTFLGQASSVAGAIKAVSDIISNKKTSASDKSGFVNDPDENAEQAAHTEEKNDINPDDKK